MYEKKAFVVGFIICALAAWVLGAVVGYSVGGGVRPAEATNLATDYERTIRERDSTIERITEDNQRLREGALRAQSELGSAMARSSRLDEYLGSAGIGAQQITATLSGTRQNIEEASRIIGSYLGAEQADENNALGGDSGSGIDRIDNNLGAD